MAQTAALQQEASSRLSGDLWLSVFSRLDWRDLANVQLVASTWHELVASSDHLWQRHYQERQGCTPHSRCSSNEMGGCAIGIGGVPLPSSQVAPTHTPWGPGSSIQPSTPTSSPSSQACEGDGRGTPPAGSSSTFPSDMQAAGAASQERGAGMCGDGSSWRQRFQHSIELEHNWARGVCRSSSLEGHTDVIRCMQLSGGTLVSCSGSTSHADCSVRVWDVQEGRCRRVLRGHMGPIWCMMYEPALDRIATGSEDYTVRYWDASTGNSVVMEDPDSAVRCVHMDVVGRQLVAGTEFGRLLLWDMDHLEEVLSDAVQHVVEEFERLAQVHAAACAPNGRPQQGGRAAAAAAAAASGSGYGNGLSLVQRAEAVLAGRHVTADGSNHVRLVDAAEEGKAISAIQVQEGLCASTSIEPLSQIQLWDVSRSTWAPAGVLGEPEMQYANSLSFDKQIGALVAGCGDKNVRVWDLATGARLHLLSGHTEAIFAHQFDARVLASAGLDGRICMWDMRTGRIQHVLHHDSPLHAFQFYGDRLVSGTWDGRVCLWDLRGGSLVQEWYDHSDRVCAVACDAYHLASAGFDRTVCLRSFLPGEELEDERAALRQPCPAPLLAPPPTRADLTADETVVTPPAVTTATADVSRHMAESCEGQSSRDSSRSPSPSTTTTSSSTAAEEQQQETAERAKRQVQPLGARPQGDVGLQRRHSGPLPGSSPSEASLLMSSSSMGREAAGGRASRGGERHAQSRGQQQPQSRSRSQTPGTHSSGVSATGMSSCLSSGILMVGSSGRSSRSSSRSRRSSSRSLGSADSMCRTTSDLAMLNLVCDDAAKQDALQQQQQHHQRSGQGQACMQRAGEQQGGEAA